MKKENKEKLFKNHKLKKEFVLVASTLSLIIGGTGVHALSNKIAENREQRMQAELILQKEAEEKARLLELKKKYPSVNEEGLNYAYDSNLIWERLSSYDYSKIDNEKVVFLTYDDGPSTTNTPIILDTLKKHGVKATFFVTGKTLEDGGDEAKNILKNAYNSGHSIANHSYSHNYNLLYPGRHLNKDAFLKDFSKTDKMLKEVLGNDFKTKTWRLPGGLMSWKSTDSIKEYAKENGIGLIDWNALNKDAEGKKKNADELYQEAVNTSKDKDMVVLLMHDTYGKEETAKYTDRIIQYYKDNGYVFKTLA